MGEKISVIYNPVTDIPTAGTAYHMTLVYTDSSGQSFYASAGPTQAAPADVPTASAALGTASNNIAGPYGTITARVDAFNASDPANNITYDPSGTPLPSKDIASGDDLSSKWTNIVQTYTDIASLGIPYAPSSQNSNSVAGTAIPNADIPLPFDSSTKWSPGEFLKLPTNQSDLQKFNGEHSFNETDDADGTKNIKYSLLNSDDDYVSNVTAKNGQFNSGVEKFFYNNAAYIFAEGQAGTANADNSIINIYGNTNENISGSGDVINLQINSEDNIGVFGQNQIVIGDSGNNSVNLGGDGTTVTVYGGGYVGFINNGQTLTLGDAGSTVLTAPNIQGDVIIATGASITFAAGTTGNVLGQNDTVTLQSNTGSSVGVQGTGMVVNGDGGNDLVNLAGDGTTATVNGGGLVGLTGDHETVRVGLDQRETIEVAPGVSHDTIYADNSEIDLPAGWSGSIYGEGLSIHMTPDSGSQINLYGYDDTISGREGNSVIADAYDPADPSDPYAPYQEGDPEPGEPYDPEDPDPPDPCDPGDPWDEERVSTASTTQENKASSASASPELTGHQQLVSAMASFGATSQGDTIHPATAHQQTPDLAADASVARHKIAA